MTTISVRPEVRLTKSSRVSPTKKHTHALTWWVHPGAHRGSPPGALGGSAPPFRGAHPSPSTEWINTP
jgi:hypothetical protein